MLMYSALLPVFLIRSRVLRIVLAASTLPVIESTFAGVGFSPESTSIFIASCLSLVLSLPAALAHEGSSSTLERPSKIKLQGCVSASLITHSAVTPLAPPLTKNTDSGVTELPASEVAKSRTFFGETVTRLTADLSERKYPTSLMFESGSCSSCRMRFAASSADSFGCRSIKRQKTSGHSTLAVLTNPESPLTTAPYSPDPIPSCPSILQTETKMLRRLPEFEA